MLFFAHIFSGGLYSRMNSFHPRMCTLCSHSLSRAAHACLFGRLGRAVIQWCQSTGGSLYEVTANTVNGTATAKARSPTCCQRKTHRRSISARLISRLFHLRYDQILYSRWNQNRIISTTLHYVIVSITICENASINVQKLHLISNYTQEYCGLIDPPSCRLCISLNCKMSLNQTIDDLHTIKLLETFSNVWNFFFFFLGLQLCSGLPSAGWEKHWPPQQICSRRWSATPY